ncbi:MAG: hypothetical protein AAF682_25980 [Planctomycetota bacterium]
MKHLERLFLLASLLPAAHAQTSDSEIGADDFRLSDAGPDGDPTYGANSAAAAYNPANNEFLIVWSANDVETGGREIFGQRINATTGAELGENDFRISDMGSEGETKFDAFSPAVVFNPTAAEYLVVWEGDDDTGSLTNNEFEIFAQRLDASGQQLGDNDFRISDAGAPGKPQLDATSCAVAYNGTANEYLVVWQADLKEDGLADNEFEIFAQRLDAAGQELGVDDFRVSDMGPDGSTAYGAFTPSVAYNSTQDEYLVVWSGTDDESPLAPDEFEIFAQRLAGETAEEVGLNDARISDMGPDGDPAYEARTPAVAFDPLSDDYLVAWAGSDDGTTVAGEHEIYAQIVNGPNGAEIGPNDFRVSDMGPDGDPAYDAANPAVSFNQASALYLVVWAGDDNSAPLVDNELEIFAQRLETGSGAELGTNDLRLSSLGPDGDPNFAAGTPPLPATPTVATGDANEALIAWEGDDDTPPLVDGELEIFAQRVHLCPTEQVASELIRLGDPPNPNALTPGLTAGPVLGSVWDPSIDHTTFAPDALLDFLGVSPQTDNAPTPFGTVLCGLPSAELTFTSPAGEPFGVPIPVDCNLSGLVLCAQGGALGEGGELSLTNALDVTLGTL